MSLLAFHRAGRVPRGRNSTRVDPCLAAPQQNGSTAPHSLHALQYNQQNTADSMLNRAIPSHARVNSRRSTPRSAGRMWHAGSCRKPTPRAPTNLRAATRNFRGKMDKACGRSSCNLLIKLQSRPMRHSRVSGVSLKRLIQYQFVVSARCVRRSRHPTIAGSSVSGTTL